MIDSPIEILAPLVALIVAYVFFYEGLIYNVGNNGTFWSTVRSVLPYVDDEARDVGFYTQYTVSEDELVGIWDVQREDAVNELHSKGFIDAPLAAHKEDWKGRQEVASLGHYGYHGEEIESWPKLKRFLMMAFVIQKQLHVTMFEDDDGLVVTAHYENSPYNVQRAYKHLRGKNYDVEKGVSMVTEKLEDVNSFDP